MGPMEPSQEDRLREVDGPAHDADCDCLDCWIERPMEKPEPYGDDGIDTRDYRGF